MTRVNPNTVADKRRHAFFPAQVASGIKGSPLLTPADLRREEDLAGPNYTMQSECTAGPVETMKEIPRHMNRLFNVSDALERRVIELENVLDSVLRPEFDAACNGGEIKAATNTGLGQAIEGIVDRLENVAGKVEGLIARVQV